MPLTTCPDCGREISSLAPACVHCGRPMQTAPSSGPECPMCSAPVTHPAARTGGRVWCERCGGQLVYGTDGALVRAVPRGNAHVPAPPAAVPVVVVSERKSVGLAVLLTLLFGPLGMAYSTVGGAFIMFFITLFVAGVTMGVGLILTWPICVLWAAHAASEHNRRQVYPTMRV